MRRFIVLIVGVVFVALGAFLYFRNATLAKNCTVETEATVVDMDQRLDTDSETTDYRYYPILEYQAGGNTVRVTMDSGSTTPAYSIDEKITILYNPNKVKEFIVKGEKTSAIFSIVFVVLGVLIAAYGVKVAVKKEQ